MHLLETYALRTGSKIGKPFIVKKFYPTGVDRYITVHNSSGMASKCYDYFQQVIDLLLPILQKYDIKIIQIGGKDDAPLENAIHLQGVTNINQTAYILDNSMLHVGNDSFAIHMANAFGTKSVGLYSITLPEIAGPIFDKNISICIYPDSEKPSFNPNESPKRINKIKPEDIVNACINLLFPDEKQINTKTLFIGNRFGEPIIECVPNQVIHPEFFKGHVLNLRCDYLDSLDINILANNLSVRQCSIVTDKPIDLSFVPMLKHNLAAIIYNVTNGLDINFIKVLDSLGVRYVCCFDNSKGDQDKLLSMKEDLIDFCGIEEFNSIPENFEKSLLEIKNLKFKSNRIILANGKIFSSLSAYLEDIVPQNNIPNSEISLDSIKNKNKFLEDIDYCILYKD